MIVLYNCSWPGTSSAPRPEKHTKVQKQEETILNNKTSWIPFVAYFLNPMDKSKLPPYKQDPLLPYMGP